MVEQVIAAFLVATGLVAPLEGAASSIEQMAIQEKQTAVVILQEVARNGVEKLHGRDDGFRGPFDPLQTSL